MTTSLQGLKIPRGYRGDWPVFEYNLIDYVQGNLAELETAREGYGSLVSNLNSKYASKSYVQIAVLSPTPGDIEVTDLSVAALDSGKIGYSLQVNNAGTGLEFGNTYTLGCGTFADPALNFNDGADAGIYCVNAGSSENLKIKVGGVLVCEMVKVVGSNATAFNVGATQIQSGGIFTGGLYGTLLEVSAYIAALNIQTTGTGVNNKSTMAEVEVVKGTFTGTGADATLIAEATVVTLNQGTMDLASGSSDANDLKTTTKDYFCNSACANIPAGSNGGRLSVFYRSASNVFQEFQGVSLGTFSRQWDGTYWSAWMLASGAAGGTGPAGPAGPAGPTGPTGPAGPAGSDGSDGSDGSQGPQGVQGPQGPQGIQGPAGPTIGMPIVASGYIVLDKTPGNNPVITVSGSYGIQSVATSGNDLVVTFTTLEPNNRYIVVGNVTGGYLYGGRSLEPHSKFANSFSLSSSVGGDNTSGPSWDNNLAFGSYNSIVNFIVVRTP